MGKVLVTGANGEIGAAIVETLVRAGWEVIASDQQATLHGEGSVTYAQLDVTDAATARAVIELHGPFDAYVGNAGIVIPQPARDVDDDTLRKHLEVNVVGNLRLARLIGSQLLDTGAGSIVFTGSWVQERPWPELLSYSASKAALAMAAKTLAMEWASSGVRVNIVAPGIVNAGMAKAEAARNPDYARRISIAVPLGRLQTVDDVANAVAFLLSDQATSITGTTVVVDGGCSLGNAG